MSTKDFVPEPGAQYQDRHGDVWEWRVDESGLADVRVNGSPWFLMGTSEEVRPEHISESLGPLTRINNDFTPYYLAEQDARGTWSVIRRMPESGAGLVVETYTDLAPAEAVAQALNESAGATLTAAIG